MGNRFFIFTFTFFSLLFVNSQALLPTSCDFSGMTLPGVGWTANSPQYYPSSGNPAPSFKFDASGKYLRINFTGTPSTLTFDIAGHSVQSENSIFKVQESDDGSNYTDIATYNKNSLVGSYVQQNLNLSSNTRYVQFIYVQKGSPGGGNIGIDNIVINPGISENQEIKVYVDNNIITNQSTQYTGAPSGASSILPFSIENSGQTGALKIDSVVFSGTESAAFSLNNQLSFPENIIAQSSLDIGIVFSPQASGPHTSTVSIHSNDLDSPVFTFNIIGYGDNYEAEPTEQPTGLSFQDVKTYRLRATFTTSDADGFLVLMKKGSMIVDIPQDGQVYTPGDVIGNAKVVQSSNSDFFIPREIVANTDFYFSIFAYNGSGPFTNYLTDNPLQGSVKTPETMMPPNKYNLINTASSNFINDLHDLISPHIKNTYDSYKDKLIEQFYERDTSNSKKVLTCLYTGELYIYEALFSHGGVGITREHTFAFSWFPLGDNNQNYYSDYHNLFPIHQNRANVIRSNYPFGIVVSDTMVHNGNGILGRDHFGNIVYEPRDEHKGDVARALFYMCTRYTENEVNWHLPNYISWSIPYAQDQALLKRWNLQDPPSGLEIARNDFIDSLQNNRNPFIDNYEFACFINFSNMTHYAKGCEDLGLSEKDLLQSLIVYPNPAQRTITIALDISKIIGYKIFDASGRLVKEESVQSIATKTIDVSTFKKGIYIINIATESGNISKKFIIE